MWECVSGCLNVRLGYEQTSASVCVSQVCVCVFGGRLCGGIVSLGRCVCFLWGGVCRSRILLFGWSTCRTRGCNSWACAWGTVLYMEDLGEDSFFSAPTGKVNLILLQDDHRNISSVLEVNIDNLLYDNNCRTPFMLFHMMNFNLKFLKTFYWQNYAAKAFFLVFSFFSICFSFLFSPHYMLFDIHKHLSKVSPVYFIFCSFSVNLMFSVASETVMHEI